MRKFIILVVSFFAISSGAHEEQKHQHESEEAHAEENSNVGENKGITVFDEHDGFKLSSEAIKNFELKTVPVQGKGPWTVPAEAILLSGEETNIYRVRDGFYKRIDFTFVDKKQRRIQSKNLHEGDAIVVSGLGFLRTAEIVASGGAPEGHSH